MPRSSCWGFFPKWWLTNRGQWQQSWFGGFFSSFALGWVILCVCVCVVFTMLLCSWRAAHHHPPARTRGAPMQRPLSPIARTQKLEETRIVRSGEDRVCAAVTAPLSHSRPAQEDRGGCSARQSLAGGSGPCSASSERAGAQAKPLRRARWRSPGPARSNAAI